MPVNKGFWKTSIPTTPVLEWYRDLPWLPVALEAIQAAVDLHRMSGNETVDAMVPSQWCWYEGVLGPPTHKPSDKKLRIWELPEPGWYMWVRVIVPQYTRPWLEIPVKDARPEIAAAAVRIYWEALGLGFWRDLVAMVSQAQPP